jgi:hypothetical protein
MYQCYFKKTIELQAEFPILSRPLHDPDDSFLALHVAWTTAPSRPPLTWLDALVPSSCRFIMASAKPVRTEVETWGSSASKALLRAGILSGEIPADRLPKAVFNMNPEVHGKWKYINWANNLRTLRNAIHRDRSRMQRDAIAYGQTLQIVRARFAPTTPLWHLSDCPTLRAKKRRRGKAQTNEAQGSP